MDSNLRFSSQFVFGDVKYVKGGRPSAKSRQNAIGALSWNLSKNPLDPALKAFAPEVKRVHDYFAKHDKDYQSGERILCLSGISNGQRVTAWLTGPDRERYQVELGVIEAKYESQLEFDERSGELTCPGLEEERKALKARTLRDVISSGATRQIDVFLQPHSVSPSKTKNPYDSVEVKRIEFKPYLA